MSTPSPRTDLLSATAVSAVPLAVVLSVGDAMFLGLAYYIIVPALLLAACHALRAAPYFRTGAAVALALSYVPFMAYNLQAARPEGLLGLGHVFSMPGLFALALFGAWRSARDPAGAALALTVGFLITLAGFALNLVVVCNTMLYCGGWLG